MMAEERFSAMKNRHQRGSIITYVLIAIFLTGLLIAALSQGAKKTASTTHLDEMMLYLQVDVKTIQEALSECVQTNPAGVDVNSDGAVNATDNPNAPFPLYGTGADTLANLSSGGAGTAVANIRCPGAPDGQRAVFSGNMGNKFKLLGNTAAYTTTYVTDGTEGVYMRLTRATGEPLWTEAISRLNGKFSGCTAAAVTAAGACANGCFYYWFVRRSSSALATESGACP